MLGEGTVTIGGRQWVVSVAYTSRELALGLSGLTSIPANTGMLLDLGTLRAAGITTEQMLFNIDVVYIGLTAQGMPYVSAFSLDLAPGQVIEPSVAARYILEINVGEAANLEVGDVAQVYYTRHWMDRAVETASPIVMMGMIGLLMYRVLLPRKKSAQLQGQSKHSKSSDTQHAARLARQQASDYTWRGTEYTDAPYELEANPRKGIVYLHDLTVGKTFLRICRVSEDVFTDMFEDKKALIDLASSRARLPIRHFPAGGTFKKSPMFVTVREKIPPTGQPGFFIEDEAGIIWLEVRGVPEQKMRTLRDREFTDITVGYTGRKTASSLRSQRKDPYETLKKSQEVAEDIQELIKTIFFTQERVSCVPCMHYQKVESLVDPDTLTSGQQVNLLTAKGLAPELTHRQTVVRVAIFDEPNIIGATDGKIVFISPHRLSRRATMLNTVSHEAAHILTKKDDDSPVFQQKASDLTNFTLKYLQLDQEDKEQLVKEYGVWAASIAEKMAPPGDIERAKVYAGRLLSRLLGGYSGA